ncbi:MAG: hypothetical protein ACHP9Z_11045 [Streptosporangiales bacterium]
MIDDHRTGIWQHNTHDKLVGRAGAPTTPPGLRRLDAIIVPASRPAANLDSAISLARAVDSRLLILCSRDTEAAAVHQLLDSRLFTQAVVIDLPPEYTHPLIDFATTGLVSAADMPKACAARNTDLSMKRNLGLVIARMLDWQTIFFMDDDIRDINPAHLVSTVAMLGRYRAVGMRVASFPDNSVVCHAHRETGEFQDVLVSGSALAVDCTAPLSFFPDVYNEDWLFFYDDVAAGRLGCSGLNATQLRYDPFADPTRATGQEFGDVLAEGLYALLHQGRGSDSATREYWQEFLEARREFLAAIIDRADAAPPHVRDEIVAAVQAAHKCSLDMAPDKCARYVEEWRRDVKRWQKAFSAVPRGLTVSEALRQLDLTAAADGGMVRGISQSPHEEPTPTRPGPVLGPYIATPGRLSRATPVLARAQHAPVGAALTALLERETPSPDDVEAVAPEGFPGPELLGPGARADTTHARPRQPVLAGSPFGVGTGAQVLGGIAICTAPILGALADEIGVDAAVGFVPLMAVGCALLLFAGLVVDGGWPGRRRPGWWRGRRGRRVSGRQA